jgi:hypothetical protein
MLHEAVQHDARTASVAGTILWKTANPDAFWKTANPGAFMRKAIVAGRPAPHYGVESGKIRYFAAVN